MPELPEVETTRIGLGPLLLGKKVEEVHVFQSQLRYPVPEELGIFLLGQTLLDISRRAKYLILKFDCGNVVVHLGMSGSLCVVDTVKERRKHDHVEVIFKGGSVLRYHDPRRFGSWQFFHSEEALPFSHLGPEPLSNDFSAEYLFTKTRKLSTTIKQIIMNQKYVVGVGNIYASEALFRAKIHPLRQGTTINFVEIARLVDATKDILLKAIETGGTTLNDFRDPNNNPGYFAQELAVYGRSGEKCRECEADIRKITLGQRSTFFCPICQYMN